MPSRSTDASQRPATESSGAAGAGVGDHADTSVKARVSGWWSLWGPHVRRFAPTVLVSHAVTLAVAIALAVVIGIGETFTAVPAMVGSFWMVANLAPVEFTGAQLGIVPLLPAALIALVHSRRVRAACGTQITVRNIRVFGVLAVTVPMVLTCLAWLVLWDASHVFDIAPPNILVALLSTGLLNGFVFVVGLGPKIWRALLLRRGLPTWPVESVRLAGRFVRWMLVAGLAATLLQLALNFSVLSDAYSIAPDAWGRVGLTVLSLLYLPNLAVSAAGVLMGSELHIGDASASLFAVTNANLPPLPVLAAVPHSDLRFGEVLLVVPALIALLLVYRFIGGRSFVEAPVFTALGAGVAAGVLGLLVSLAAGGALGVYGSAGPLLWLTPLVFVCWMVVPALLVFEWVSRQGSRVTESAGPGEVDEHDEEDEEPQEEEEEFEQTAEDDGEDAAEDAAEDAPEDDAPEDGDTVEESGGEPDAEEQEGTDGPEEPEEPETERQEEGESPDEPDEPDEPEDGATK